jgi:hypothetical protein
MASPSKRGKIIPKMGPIVMYIIPISRKRRTTMNDDRMKPNEDSEEMRRADKAPDFYEWRLNKNDFVRNDSNINDLFHVMKGLNLIYDANGYNCAWDVVRIVRRYDKEIR